MIETINLIYSGGYMKKLLIVIAGTIILILPGGLTLMVIWSIIFPRHRKLIINLITKIKGDVIMAMQTIIGKRTDEDRKYVAKLDLSSIDSTRIESADKAFAYVEAKHQERMTTFTPALMVGMFGIGAALIATLWVLSSVFPV
jgi:UPF0716 family protein affecting phage T7 exclusion